MGHAWGLAWWATRLLPREALKRYRFQAANVKCVDEFASRTEASDVSFQIALTVPVTCCQTWGAQLRRIFGGWVRLDACCMHACAYPGTTQTPILVLPNQMNGMRVSAYTPQPHDGAVFQSLRLVFDPSACSSDTMLCLAPTGYGT